jgi:hypothetical protein
MPRLLYAQGIHTWYPLDVSLGGPYSWSEYCAGEENVPSAGKQNPAIQPIAHCYTGYFLNKSALPVLQFERGSGSECGSLSGAEASHEA